MAEMEKPPAYTEYPPSSPFATSTLSQHLIEVRAVRINNTISNNILPKFQAGVASGLSRSTLILLPEGEQGGEQGTDVKRSGPEPEVIGFASAENMNVVRLGGEDNAVEFWQQAAVVRELESMLKSRLKAAGHRIWAPAPPPAIPSPDALPSPSTKKGGQFFRRKQSASSSDMLAQPTRNGAVEGSWSTPQVEPLMPGEMKVDVQLKDISMRIVTDMGLYDSETRKGMIVKMEIGG